MANSGYNFQVTPCGPIAESNNELNFRGLYLHHIPIGPNPTQSTVVSANPATGLGETAVNNWPIYDGLGPYANVVARAQGLHILAGGWHNSFTVVFEDARFRGSTLQVMGLSVEEGEWSIVGGTGQFAMARGIINKRLQEQRNNGNIIEITMHGYCPVLKGSQHMGMGPQQCPGQLPTGSGFQQYPVNNNGRPTKHGPWGGSGGSPRDIMEAPHRLESLTIRSGWVIDSFSFSYIDQAGQRRKAGPWGGSGGDENTIYLGPMEFVMEVSGTSGAHENHVVITSLKIVTNMRTCGPFGRTQGPAFSAGPFRRQGDPFSTPMPGNAAGPFGRQLGDPFSTPMPGNAAGPFGRQQSDPENATIVGFFGHSGDYLDSIGVYTV